jgi:hypothetical protein
MRAYLTATMCVVGLVLSGGAFAQAPSQPTPAVPPTNPPPEVIAPNPGSAAKSGTSVIRPPSVDPGMSVKPPADAGQSSAVIPPPGSPGGNPNVIPK